MKARGKKNKNALHAIATLLVIAGFGVGAYFAMNSSLFHLKEVNVEPPSEGYPLTAEQILDLARIPLGKFNLFALNLNPIVERLVKHPWVKGVVVSKQFPNSLVLKIVERKPVSLLNELNGRILYIEEDGVAFEDKAMVYTKELPLIAGFSAQEPENLKKINNFIQTWFDPKVIPGLKLSSVNYDSRNGVRAMVIFPLKNKQTMRAVLELGLNIEEASHIPKERFKKVLDYLYDRSTPASKIWLGDGKKIVVKVSRGS